MFRLIGLYQRRTFSLEPYARVELEPFLRAPWFPFRVKPTQPPESERHALPVHGPPTQGRIHGASGVSSSSGGSVLGGSFSGASSGRPSPGSDCSVPLPSVIIVSLEGGGESGSIGTFAV